MSTAATAVEDRGSATSDRSPGKRRAPRGAWLTQGRIVVLCAALLVLIQIASRIWIVGERWLFGDDIALVTQSARELFSAHYLIDQRGGHLVPGALLLSGALMRLAPLEWWPLAIASVVLQTLASLAVWRLIRVFMGDRPAMLVPLAVYLFSTVNLGAFTWWSAAMQTVPLQIGMAWMVADSVLYLRTRRTRYAVTAPSALALTLLFSERAVTIPLLALGVAAVLMHVEGHLDPLRETWRRTRALWWGVLLVVAAWTFGFTAAVPREAYSSVSVSSVVETVRYFLWNVIPGLAGGPWKWQTNPGSTPIATTPHGLFVVSVVVMLALIAWTSWRRRGAPLLWMVAIGFAATNGVLLALGRGGFGLDSFLPLAYRYYPAEPVLLALVVAVLFTLPLRTTAPTDNLIRRSLQIAAAEAGRRIHENPVARWTGRLIVPVLTVLVVAGSAVSTVGHVEAWSQDPAKQYFANARADLAEAGRAPLLDQDVPEKIMWGLGAPFNTTATLFAPFPHRPTFGEVTDQLRMFDQSGRLRPARIHALRRIQPGPLANCGWGVYSDRTTPIALSGPLINWPWTAQVNYLAGDDGVITIALGDGKPLRVPVKRGPHALYLRLSGTGDQLRVTSDTVGLGVCIDSGMIGLMSLH